MAKARGKQLEMVEEEKGPKMEEWSMREMSIEDARVEVSLAGLNCRTASRINDGNNQGRAA